jgi:hypothetical protein
MIIEGSMNSKNKLIVTTICASILASVFANPAFAGRRLGLTGEINPEFTGRQIKKMVVVAPNVVKYFRAQIEKRMCNRLKSMSNGGVTGVRFENVVTGFKKHTGPEVIALLKQQRVDAVAVVDIKMDGSNYTLPASQDDSLLPGDMLPALEYIANYKYQPRFNGKYRTTTVTVYDVKTGGVIWKGQGIVNATQDSRKWHKKSGKYLAIRFAKYMHKARLLTYTPDAPDPDEVDEVTGTNYTSGDEA